MVHNQRRFSGPCLTCRITQATYSTINYKARFIVSSSFHFICSHTHIYVVWKPSAYRQYTEFVKNRNTLLYVQYRLIGILYPISCIVLVVYKHMLRAYTAYATLQEPAHKLTLHREHPVFSNSVSN